MLTALVDLVLPQACLGCGRPGRPLCVPCSAVDLHPVVTTPELRVMAAARYEGGLRAALIAYKERGRRDLAAPLGDLLTLAIGAFEARDAVLVPVPSTASARRARGGDHVVRLGRAAGRCESVLRLVRGVRDSAGLDTAARAANLTGAMGASPPSGQGRPVVIIDDITTTGATLTEAARALRSAGWPVLGGAVVAATPRIYPLRTAGAGHLPG